MTRKVEINATIVMDEYLSEEESVIRTKRIGPIFVESEEPDWETVIRIIRDTTKRFLEREYRTAREPIDDEPEKSSQLDLELQPSP